MRVIAVVTVDFAIGNEVERGGQNGMREEIIMVGAVTTRRVARSIEINMVDLSMKIGDALANLTMTRTTAIGAGTNFEWKVEVVEVVEGLTTWEVVKDAEDLVGVAAAEVVEVVLIWGNPGPLSN
jgi:hypothetical protein